MQTVYCKIVKQAITAVAGKQMIVISEANNVCIKNESYLLLSS